MRTHFARWSALAAACAVAPLFATFTIESSVASGGLSAAAASSSSGPDTSLVSVAADGGPANGWADRPQISDDGRFVTFDSNATNLVSGIPAPERRVYRRDLLTGNTEVVSASSTGAPATAWSSFPWSSDDGDLVAFVSDDTTLTTPNARGRSVFMRHMTDHTTELVSVNNSGQPANGASSRPMVSPDGRYVAFSSYATNLTPEGNNGQEQTYLRDRLTGTTTLVSHALSGGVGNNRSFRGMVSDNGRFVAFASSATNLTSGTSPAVESIFVRDLIAGTTQRISVRSGGQPAPLGGSRPYLSSDGQHVVFNTYDPLLANDQSGKSDVYLVNRVTGAIERQSVSSSGGDSNGDSLRGFITDDGRFTVFNSFASTLTTNDKNSSGDVFIRDRTTNSTKLLSVSWLGGGANGQSFRPVMSGDGSVVAYLSKARNLVRDDPSTDYQVYVVTADTVDGQPDTTPPSVTVTSPTANATVPSPLTLRGTASDNRAVDQVFVQLRDNGSGLWLRPNGTWGSGAVRIPATVASRYAASTTWSLELALEPGSYGFNVSALDIAGNQPVTKPWTPFKVGVVDTTAPTVTVTSPQHGTTVSSPVTLSGTATDNLRVDRVYVQVRDNASGLWLRPNGTWGSGATRLPTTLDSPGTASTRWSTSLSLAAGSYGFNVTAFDAAGNQPANQPWTSFRVS